MAYLYDPFRPDPRLTMPPIPRLGRDAATGPVTLLAYVDRYVPMVNAGAEWMLHAMLADSVARGHRVIVATPCTDRPRVVDGVEVYPVREGLRVGADAELVVGHLLFTREAIDLARSTQRPLVYLVHNSDQLKAWRITRDDVSALVWNSEWIARAGRYLPDVRTVPGTTVRPPLDMARYVTPQWSPRTHVTLVNPIQAKGSPIFYALAARFPRYRFLAVEGAYGSQQRPQVQHRNVDWQPATATIAEDVYARTRVLLMPSTYESWGRVACEALCSGIPVIASPTPGLREALGDAATFVDPHDVAGWARALTDLDDLGTYADASERALARAVELDALARLDLDRWDRLVRLAAGTTRVRSGLMETTPVDKYDPFRGSKAKAPRQEVATEATAAPPALDAPGAPEDAGEPQEATQAPDPVPWAVPDKAVDIVHALGSVSDPAEAERRARAVWEAERQRETPRKSVLAAAEKILG